MKMPRKDKVIANEDKKKSTKNAGQAAAPLLFKATLYSYYFLIRIRIQENN